MPSENISQYVVNQNYILAITSEPEKLEVAVQQLAEIYADTGFTREIELYNHPEARELFLLRFQNEPDFERFMYFVNYLVYPEEVAYEVEIRGFFSLRETDKPLSPLQGKRVMLYVSENDSEGDNVYAVTPENKSYKLGFSLGEELAELPASENDFSEPQLMLKAFRLAHVIRPTLGSEAKASSGSGGCTPMLAMVVFGLALLSLWV